MKRTYQFGFLETNFLPSLANFENENEGVRSQMTQVGSDPTKYPVNGLKLDDLRDLHSLHGLDPIDQQGLASAQLLDTVEKVSKSETHKQFTNYLKQQKQNVRKN